MLIYASTHRLNVLKQFLGEQADADLERRIGLLIDAEIKMKYDRIFNDFHIYNNTAIRNIPFLF